MPAASFKRKQLRFSFTLANGAVFSGTNNNTLVLEGYRAIVNIKACAPNSPAAQVQIFGMSQSDMNQLTFLGFVIDGLLRNTLTIETNAGDGWTVAFKGDVIQAGPDYSGAPDVILRAQAVAIYYGLITPADPSSYTTATDVATIVGKLAEGLGMTFENNNVHVQLAAPYLPNTLGEQLKTVCQQAGVDLYIDGDVVAITPAGQPRAGQQVLLNPQSGLVGYPTLDNNGVQLACLYTPALRFGGALRIEGSDVPKANGNWCVYSLDHYLEAEKPGGSWLSYLACAKAGQVIVLQ